MNRRIISIVALLMLGLSAFSLQLACAATYSSKALIENAIILNGRKVTYKGEAVTAIMRRGENSWVNVNDGDNAIGVWCKSSVLGPVKVLGDYKHIGDILEIEGVFNRACPVHGGDLDMHADKIKVLKTGFLLREQVIVRKIFLAIVLFLLTIVVTAVFRKRI